MLIKQNFKQQVYLFSGLGADQRVFEKLDFSGLSITHVSWTLPLKKETIEQYAARIKTQINTEAPILIGLSFGGIMAVEVAKQIETAKVILIASAKIKTEIPFYYRVIGYTGLHKIIPVTLLKSSNRLTSWFFGAGSNTEKILLKQILKDTDPVFLRWAIDKIVRWQNQTPIKNIFHIHGDNDKILPIKFINYNAVVKRGGHLMTLNKVEELNSILHRQLL